MRMHVRPRTTAAALTIGATIALCFDARAEEATKAPASGAVEQPTEIETSPAEGDSIVQGLSWDLMAGGVPSGGALLEGGIGFSGLLKAGYHYTLQPQLSVGGTVSFDYAYWAPRYAWAPSLLLQGSARYSLLSNDAFSIGLRADPGLGFFFSGDSRSDLEVGLLLNVGASIGWYVENRMVIGGGIDLPILLGIPTGPESIFLQVPILIGPLFEFHVTPPLALTFDLKMGPNLRTSVESAFGLKMMAGIAFRL